MRWKLSFTERIQTLTQFPLLRRSREVSWIYKSEQTKLPDSTMVRLLLFLDLITKSPGSCSGNRHSTGKRGNPDGNDIYLLGKELKSNRTELSEHGFPSVSDLEGGYLASEQAVPAEQVAKTDLIRRVNCWRINDLQSGYEVMGLGYFWGLQFSLPS